jgi:hypothetical protein
MHFSLPSEETWNQVGDRLVPKEIWKGILQGRIGMRTVLVQAEVPGFPDSKQEAARVMVRAEPSGTVKLGVFFQVNEHHEASKTDASEYLMERLRTRWEGAYIYASEVADYILSSIVK